MLATPEQLVKLTHALYAVRTAIAALHNAEQALDDLSLNIGSVKATQVLIRKNSSNIKKLEARLSGIVRQANRGEEI